eukprot:1715574-Rhodomonas_salina.2
MQTAQRQAQGLRQEAEASKEAERTAKQAMEAAREEAEAMRWSKEEREREHGRKTKLLEEEVLSASSCCDAPPDADADCVAPRWRRRECGSSTSRGSIALIKRRASCGVRGTDVGMVVPDNWTTRLRGSGDSRRQPRRRTASPRASAPRTHRSQRSASRHAGSNARK